MTSEELSKALSEIANGDVHAENFCRALYQFVHVLDDLVDRDVDRSAGDVAMAVVSLVGAVGLNPFFQAHRDVLFGAISMAALSWAGSEKLKKSEKLEHKLAAEVVKSAYQDVFFLVASLTGGMEHGLAVADRWRGYAFG